MGLSLIDMAVLVHAYRRAQREVVTTRDRNRRISTTICDISVISSHTSLSLFGFFPQHICELAKLLDVPSSISRTRLGVSPVEKLCIIFGGLSSPARLYDLELLFERSSTALRLIFFSTVEALMAKWGPFLSEWRDDFMRERAPMYAMKIEEAGAYLDRCFGFIDGTAIFIALPGGGLQRACYSGHKRKHAVMFESVITPDGLIIHLFGPWEERRHDKTLYYKPGLDSVLPDALHVGVEQYYLYRDAAYMVRSWLQAEFCSLMTLVQEDCNGTMKVPRAAVVWGFKHV